ncbi:galactose-3-O-sulfotransferase 2-like [Lineus longissimus]|uniref:galactose-3-O-sulfotransferase 2-like n=1 Tax=Lineus longissimus TaxID=88925 RepID=UPI002B4EF765
MKERCEISGCGREACCFSLGQRGTRIISSYYTSDIMWSSHIRKFIRFTRTRAGREVSFFFLVLLCVCLVYSNTQLLANLLKQTSPLRIVYVKERKSQVTHSFPKNDMVYIKMIKCGSTTLNSMFHRYGYTRNLSFVLPVKGRIYLGWPYRMQKGFFRPPIAEKFNILSEHAVYDRRFMASIMPNDTVYITSLREPYAQFKSMYNYYQVGKISTAGEGQAGYDKFMKNIERYDEIYKSAAQKRERYCVPDGFSMSKNLMSFILGLPLGYPPGTKDLTGYRRTASKLIKTTVKQFDLILILEYFHESLVMLKRLMRWNTKDILYKSGNVLKYDHKHDSSFEYRKIYRQWSELDFLLYDYANKTFWQKVSETGKNFKEEVTNYNAVKRKVDVFCATHDRKDFLSFDRTLWDEQGFIFTRYDCSLLQDMNLVSQIKKVYDTNAKESDIPEQAEPSTYFC